MRPQNKIKEFSRSKSTKRTTYFYWWLLRKSKIFNYWHERFLNELLFDLELLDLEQKEIQSKYNEKLKRIRTAIAQAEGE